MSSPAAETTPEAPTNLPLIALLEAKDAAQAAYRSARLAAQDGGDKPLTVRVSLDLAEQGALTASCRADRAYADAMRAFLAAQQQAA